MTPALMPAVAMTSDPSDRGAHFYCCDFQVHSPRDLNWTGQRPATDQERNAYAADFVRAARKKGLDAVAITDHHDLAFFPYIRAAASQLAPEVGALVVFPGVELTLGKVACQAILLFDPDLDRDALERILPTLGIEPSEQAAPEAAFSLGLKYPGSVPVFEYCTVDRQYIPFEAASPGQQANALEGGEAAFRLRMQKYGF